jgi:hypothetical protein
LSIRSTLALAVLVIAGCSTTGAPQALLLKNVTTVDVTNGTLRENREVLVEGDRIKAINNASQTHGVENMTIVDGSGKYLIPGLMDMHVHLFGQSSKTWMFGPFVGYGVTSVREMWAPPESEALINSWRDAVSSNEIVAPRILAAGVIVDGSRGWLSNVSTVESIEDVERVIVNLNGDFVKVYSSLDRDLYVALMDAARRAGIPVAGHIPLTVHALEAARLGQVTNEHLWQVREMCSFLEDVLIEERIEFYAGSFDTAQEFSFLDDQLHRMTRSFDAERCQTTAAELASTGQWQVPTLINERRWFLGPSKDLFAEGDFPFLPDEVLENWKRRVSDGQVTYSGSEDALKRGWGMTLGTVEELNRASVGFLVGTDVGQPYVVPGFAVHEEMRLLVEAGLTPLQALQAATVNPAEYLGVTDTLGNIFEGAIADLVLLDANPLSDIANTHRIDAVVLNGRLFRGEELKGLLN